MVTNSYSRFQKRKIYAFLAITISISDLLDMHAVLNAITEWNSKHFRLLHPYITLQNDEKTEILTSYIRY